MRYMIAVVVFLASCGGPMIFEKPGAGTAELEADRYACQRQWEQSAQGIAFALDPLGNAYYGVHARAVIQQCLEHKGWVRING